MSTVLGHGQPRQLGRLRECSRNRRGRSGRLDDSPICATSKQTHNQRNPEWQSNVNGRLAPDATGKTDRHLVGASPAHTAVRRSTKSTTKTFPRYGGSSPSAARSARAGSRERAAAIRARSRAQSSARASLRCCRTSPRAGTSAGNAASGPAVARAETGSGPQRTASRGTHREKQLVGGSLGRTRERKPGPSAAEFRFDPIASRGSASTWTDGRTDARLLR